MTAHHNHNHEDEDDGDENDLNSVDLTTTTTTMTTTMTSSGSIVGSSRPSVRRRSRPSSSSFTSSGTMNSLLALSAVTEEILLDQHQSDLESESEYEYDLDLDLDDNTSRADNTKINNNNNNNNSNININSRMNFEHSILPVPPDINKNNPTTTAAAAAAAFKDDIIITNYYDYGNGNGNGNSNGNGNGNGNGNVKHSKSLYLQPFESIINEAENVMLNTLTNSPTNNNSNSSSSTSSTSGHSSSALEIHCISSPLPHPHPRTRTSEMTMTTMTMVAEAEAEAEANNQSYYQQEQTQTPTRPRQEEDQYKYQQTPIPISTNSLYQRWGGGRGSASKNNNRKKLAAPSPLTMMEPFDEHQQQQKQQNTDSNNTENDDENDDDYDNYNYNDNYNDNASCYTIDDSSGMYVNSTDGNNYVDDDVDVDDGNTICTGTSNMGSTNIDTITSSSGNNSSSNDTSSNLAHSNSGECDADADADADGTGSTSLNGGGGGTISSNTSDVTIANSISSSASRGDEHISSRLRKYGIVNIHEMKRKQQQKQHRQQQQQQRERERERTGTGTGTGSNNNSNNNGQQQVQQQQQQQHQYEPSVTSSLSGGGSSGINNNNGIGSTTRHHGVAGTGTGAGIPTRIRTAPLHVQMAVEEIHRWLFIEGGHFEDVQTLMTQYSLYVREHFGIPLDRLYYGGVGLHPKLTAYLWKWEPHTEFVHSEMPAHIFARRNEIFSPDEPFCVLEQGRADHVRIRNTDTYIPPDTEKWFRGGKYIDYFALPDIHRGISKGGLAWSTKCPDGFCDDDIQFFQLTHPALTTIMRLHTNDLVLKTLTDRMESEIDDRTTELETANRKLEEANAEISRHASKQLEHFACMSHEIRTPLNCIVGLSSLLLENDDMNEELTDTVNMVYNSADLVQGVVNDVLDYAKIESGHFELDIKPSDLQSTLNGVVHSISNKLQDKNVEVRTSYDGLLQKMMTTDSRRLQQILYNILGNAAKFSRAGTTIDLKVRVVKSKKNTATTTTTDDAAACTNKIQFAIKDYGKGIDENDFEKIFQPFSQASKETQTVYGGTGLGLSITKNLVAKLGGTISIKSEIEKFTEFVVELPYHEELFDTTIYKEKALETAIVILDPTPPKEMKPTSTTACDECIPFAPAVVKGYDLNVLRCSSWGELESKLGLRANIRENYIFLAQEDIEHQAGIANVEKLVGRDRCSWFTFGSDSVGRSSHQQRHFKTLTGMFPSLLLDKIFEIVDFDRQNNGIKKSDGVSENNTTTLPEDIPSAQPTVVGPLLSPGLSPRRKFATKYPPRSLKVLIADDNAINQKVLDRILKRLGVTDITIVDNGKKAVDTSATTKFDCIFMDMEMPVMGGLEACRIIVGRDGNDNSKVVFVTAHDIADIREKGDAAGAFDYISKPLKMQDIHEFLKVIEGIKYNDDRKKNTPSSSSSSSASTSPPVNAIKTAKTAEEATTTTNTPQQQQHQPTPTNPKPRRNSKIYPPRALKVLVAEDNIINQKVLDRILKRLGVTDITIVDNGKKAVDASFITKYDCILMDMQMPIMDGLEACKQIVKRDGKENARVVFVTAHALVEFKEKALKAGGIDFVTKPFKMEDIEKLLKKLEETVPQQKESSSSSHSSSSSLPPQPQKQAEEQEQCTIATKDGDYPPSIVAVSESSSRTSTQKIYEEDQ